MLHALRFLLSPSYRATLRFDAAISAWSGDVLTFARTARLAHFRAVEDANREEGLRVAALAGRLLGKALRRAVHGY